jgi:hypothetical protein
VIEAPERGLPGLATVLALLPLTVVMLRYNAAVRRSRDVGSD